MIVAQSVYAVYIVGTTTPATDRQNVEPHCWLVAGGKKDDEAVCSKCIISRFRPCPLRPPMPGFPQTVKNSMLKFTAPNQKNSSKACHASANAHLKWNAHHHPDLSGPSHPHISRIASSSSRPPRPHNLRRRPRRARRRRSTPRRPQITPQRPRMEITHDVQVGVQRPLLALLFEELLDFRVEAVALLPGGDDLLVEQVVVPAAGRLRARGACELVGGWRVGGGC